MQDNNRVAKLEEDVGEIKRDVADVKAAQATHQETVQKIDERLERVWEVRKEDKLAAKLDHDIRQADIMGGFDTLGGQIDGIKADVKENRDYITGAKAVQDYVRGDTGDFKNPLVSPQTIKRAKVAGAVGGGVGILAFIAWLIEMLMEFEGIIGTLTQ